MEEEQEGFIERRLEISNCSCNCCQGIRLSIKGFVVLSFLLLVDFEHKRQVMQPFDQTDE